MPGYSPPAGNAVNFSFTVPVGGYTPPAGNAVNFIFANVASYTLTADPGTYTITGAAASIKVARLLNAFNNLITNGAFNVNTSSWNVSGVGTTFNSVVGQGVLALDLTASGGYAYQAITVVPGKKYRLNAFLRPSNNYTLNAGSGSYSITGCVATFVRSGDSPAIVLTDDSVSGTMIAEWAISYNGHIYHTVDGDTVPEDVGVWIVPQTGMDQYEVRATLVSGHLSSGTTGTWESLASVAQAYGVSTSFLPKLATLTIELRTAVGHTIVATKTVDLEAAGLA